MKKLISVFFLLFCLISVSAQKVMGVDINTTSKKFNAHLLKLGYRPYQKPQGELNYRVKFAGYSNVECIVKYDVVTDSITSVKMDFSKKEKKEHLSIYLNLLEQYKAKYPTGKEYNYGWEDYDCMSWCIKYDNVPPAPAGIWLDYTVNKGENRLEVIYISLFHRQSKAIPSSDI